MEKQPFKMPASKRFPLDHLKGAVEENEKGSGRGKTFFMNDPVI